VKKLAAPIAIAAALALSCPAARAECAAGADCAEVSGGRIRLDLDLGLLGFTYLQAVADDDGNGGHRSFGFNLGPAPVTRVGFGIGYDLDGRLSLGARVALGLAASRRKQAESDERGSDLAFDWAVLPYLEYAFGAGRIRPFLTVAAGVDGTVTRTTAAGVNDMGDWTDVHKGMLTLGAVEVGGGLRVFVADRVSLELSLLETAGVGKLVEKEDYAGEQGENYIDEHLAWRSRTEIVLGLTGWL
jgi:hypothetical protein